MSSSDEVNIETPTLAKVIKDAIEARLVDLHTFMPGVIISYNPAKQLAQVQPSLKKKLANGTIKALPVLNNVPVWCWQAGQASITMPTKVGDPCMIFFGERSLDNWKSQGGVSDPADTRKHHLSDAVCIPGLAAFPNSIPGDASKIIITNSAGKFTLDPSGKFTFTNGSNELMNLLVQTVQACAQIANAGGPTFNAATFTQLVTKFQTLMGT